MRFLLVPQQQLEEPPAWEGATQSLQNQPPESVELLPKASPHSPQPEGEGKPGGPQEYRELLEVSSLGLLCFYPRILLKLSCCSIQGDFSPLHSL